jgi:polyphosphate kinase 2 (PPK2 family)
MLEQVNLELAVSKADYRRRLPGLQDRLFDLEHAVFQARIPVAVVLEGWGASGKGGVIQVLAERMDPRGFHAYSITPPRTAETHYPWMWRFWQKIPAYGQIAAFNESWYRRVLIDVVSGAVSEREAEEAHLDIVDFERTLADDGAVIVKFFLHIARDEQARRFERLQADKLTAWQVSDEDRLQHRRSKAYAAAVEDAMARSDASHAPWVIVEATDRHHTRLKVLETVARTIEQRLGDLAPAPRTEDEAGDHEYPKAAHAR